jgi:hypothetical protein
LAGGALRPVDAPNPAPEWITERIWSEVLTLESLEPFKGFALNFHTYIQDYKQIFDSTEPERLVQFLINQKIDKKTFILINNFIKYEGKYKRYINMKR